MEIEIHLKKGILRGNLIIAPNSKSIIIFAHGSGSSRLSPRNIAVAEYLNSAGLSSLLMDLLTNQEEAIDKNTAKLRFDIPMLAERVIKTTQWVEKNNKTKNMNIGYFGASTGAAAALIAAAKLPNIKALVSRGGRPDLALTYLKQVRAAVLLIVGGDDIPVIKMNEEAYEELKCKKKLEIITGATHLFQEPGKLEDVAKLAAKWFKMHL